MASDSAAPTAAEDFLGLNARHARLLGQLAAQLYHHIERHDQTTTPDATRRQLVVDLDHDTDPVDLYLALLQGGAALAQNHQLRGYLAQLASQHALAALTAAHMWTLLDQAATALHHHADLSDHERELACALQQLSELGDLPIGKVPAVGVELHEELQAAHEITAALDALDEATADGDCQQVHACQRRLERAREAYHELATGHVHTDTEGSSPPPDRTCLSGCASACRRAHRGCQQARRTAHSGCQQAHRGCH
jgi:hypothetical protein